jgi:hypothetical protein
MEVTRETVQLLLDKNVDMNVQGGESGSALHAASSEGHEQMVQLLLDKNADVNADVNAQGVIKWRERGSGAWTGTGTARPNVRQSQHHVRGCLHEDHDEQSGIHAAALRHASHS